MDKKKNLFLPVSKTLIDTINNSNDIAILSHVNPDGDAIFSSLALSEILKKLGKNIYLFNDGPFHKKEIMAYESLFSPFVSDEVKAKNPLLIILDCSTEDRPGLVYQALKENVTIVIDHHESGKAFYQKELSYIIPDSPSTTLLVDEIRKALKVHLDKKCAEHMLLGFLTDTGFFHFISERQAPESFEKILAFVKTGINPYELYDSLHDGRKLSDVKIVSKIIEEAESYYDGKLIIAFEKKEYEATERPSDYVYQSLLEVEHVKAIALIKEKDDSIILGFRAKNNSGIDVGSIASSLGGGGHRLASGASVKDLKIEEAKNLVLSLFKPLLDK